MLVDSSSGAEMWKQASVELSDALIPHHNALNGDLDDSDFGPVYFLTGDIF